MNEPLMLITYAPWDGLEIPVPSKVGASATEPSRVATINCM